MKRLLPALLCTLILVTLLTPAVFADMGPKDALLVYVTNPPEELYYLDLLYTPREGASIHENLTEEQRAELDPAMLDLIHANAGEYTAVFTDGTDIPTFGTLTGESTDDGKMKHRFSYYGLPETYRLIFVTQSGQVHISEEYTRLAMQSSLTYDYAAQTAEIPPVWQQYALQFAYTCFMTLVIEGGILLLFGLSLKKDGLVFLLVNVITQIALTAFVGHGLIQGGYFTAYYRLFFAEPFILIAETTVFAFLFRSRTRGRRIAYGIVANLVSCIAGFLTTDLLYDILVSIA